MAWYNKHLGVVASAIITSAALYIGYAAPPTPPPPPAANRSATPRPATKTTPPRAGTAAASAATASTTTAAATEPATSPATATAPATRRAITHPTLPRVSEEQVTDALRRGVDYLLTHKNKDGHWDSVPPATASAPSMNDKDGYHHAVTALVTYALLHVGESLDDPRLKARSDDLAGPLKYVLAMDPDFVYGAALQSMVLAKLPKKPEYTAIMEKRRNELLRSVRGKDGGHSYALDPKRIVWGDFSDGSNSQYALLALWAIDDTGSVVPPNYWHAADKFWRSRARPDGGFVYNEDHGSTLSMTAAGVASLLITDEYTQARVTPLTAKPDPQLDAALAYLADLFDPTNVNGYTLYGVERVGLASGRKFLGPTNWFADGASALVSKQAKDGSWTFRELENFEENPAISTAFALLFLARGRNTVAFNKLEYAPVEGGAWNARPRDAMNLSDWMGRQFERPVNWQIVNMNVSVDEWLDAPVLLITGAADPHFTPEQVAKLRTFARAGGMIFSSADGDSKEFTAAVQNYALEVGADKVAGDKGAWRELPKDHAVYTVYQKMTDAPPPLFGMTNGVRELWIHSPKDLGATWHLKTHAHPIERQTGHTEKDRPWEIAANVFFLANGRGSMRSKLQTLAVDDAHAKPVRTVKLGRLKYNGNWDPEPGAFDRLAKLARARWQTELEFETVSFDTLNQAPIVYMTGTTKPDVRAEERWALRDYLKNGGILIADAANCSKDFDAWFQTLIKETFADDKWELLDDRSVLFQAKTAPGMATVGPIALRAPTQQTAGNLTKPRVYSLITREKPRVKIFYSPFDLTLGYLGTTTYGFNGYAPESAEAIARNLILYAGAVAGTRK